MEQQNLLLFSIFISFWCWFKVFYKWSPASLQPHVFFYWKEIEFLPKKIWCFLFNILILNQISFFILLVIIYLFHFLGALCGHFGLYFHVEELESWFCSSATFKIRIGRSAACRDRALRSSSFICYRLTDLILIVFIIFIGFLGSVGCNVLIWLFLIWFDSIWFIKIRCDSSHCNNLKYLSPINIRKFKIVPQDISKQTTA